MIHSKFNIQLVWSVNGGVELYLLVILFILLFLFFIK